MNKNVLNLGLIFIILALLTGCPGTTQGAAAPEEEPLSELSITIAAAQNEIDFNNETATENAVVSNAIVIKNLNLNGNTIKLKASGIELQKVNNGIVVVDKQVGEGDATLTNCNNITKLEINGGGSNSIHVNNSEIASVEVKKNNVRLALEENSSIENVVINAENSKIESDENIVINSISVNNSVDKVTVKGGTVESIQVSQSSQNQEQTQIVIDGKTEVSSITGTNDVQLTKDAIQSGSNVTINSPVPVVTYYDSTILFLSDGNVEGTEFENEDFYYEYVFDVESKDEKVNAMHFKIKIYKLPDSVKVFIFANDPVEGEGPKTQEITEEDEAGAGIYPDSVCIKNWYDATLILKSAGIIKGTFTNDRALSNPPVYDQSLNIKNCGIPEEIVLPVSPAKPTFTVTPSAQGNVISLTFNDSDDETIIDKYISKYIWVYRGVKENGKWTAGLKTLIFTKNDNTEKSVSFIDSFVEPGKEYAYIYNVNKYHLLDEDKDAFETVTATGGEGEIVLSAQNSSTDNGIKLTIKNASYLEDFNSSYSIFRFDENDYEQYLVEDKKEDPDYVIISGFVIDQGMLPIVDYYTQNEKKYIYKAQYAFWNNDIVVRYEPYIEVCPINATVGLGEPKISDTTAGSVDDENMFIFSTEPQLLTQLATEYATYNISFYYTNDQIIFFDSNPYSQAQANYNNINNWSNGTYEYTKKYKVFINYNNNNGNGSGVSYTYQYSKDHSFPEMANISK